MHHTIYVGGLGPEVTEADVLSLFSSFGEVLETRVVTRDSGECRGFAYVTFEDDLAAAKARVALDGQKLGERVLRVAPAS
jgi:RNA recognition motif-containing protein